MQYKYIGFSIILFIFITSITSAQAARVWVEPGYQEVSEGDHVTIDIMVNPEGAEVMGAEYKIHFNNTLLNATNQTEGTFLSGFPLVNEIDNINGIIKYGEFRIGEPGVTDPGILASINFTVIAEQGVSDLILYDVILSDPVPQEIHVVTTNGSIEILSGICGDVTGNGVVDTGDVILLSNYVGYYPGNSNYALDTAQQWAGDVTGNGMIDTGDVILLSNFVGYTGYSLNC